MDVSLDYTTVVVTRERLILVIHIMLGATSCAPEHSTALLPKPPSRFLKATNCPESPPDLPFLGFPIDKKNYQQASMSEALCEIQLNL